MNCQNCGGAMELMASRGYFFCRYCGSFHFPETTADDGIRILGEPSDAHACVGCGKPLASAMLDETHAVRYCRNCRGVLIERRSFASVVEKRRAWATGTPPPPVLLDRGELERRVRCPACAGLMATHPYYGPGNVVIDSCERCDLIWLDFGELKQIAEAPGKDRGTRQIARPSVSEPITITGAGARMTEPWPSREGGGLADLLYLLTRLF